MQDVFFKVDVILVWKKNNNDDDGHMLMEAMSNRMWNFSMVIIFSYLLFVHFISIYTY